MRGWTRYVVKGSLHEVPFEAHVDQASDAIDRYALYEQTDRIHVGGRLHETEDDERAHCSAFVGLRRMSGSGIRNSTVSSRALDISYSGA